MDSESLHNNSEFISELRDCATLLAEKLQNNQYGEASELIEKLVQVRDRSIFNAVGKLTRGLHNALVNFHIDADLDSEPPSIESSEIQDASNRLNYVITLTQNAADSTMDRVEAIAPVATNLGQEAGALRNEWARLRRREMSADEFRQLYRRMDSFLEQMGDGTEQLNKNLQEIILEQGYQDLSGQVLKRVIELITGVERDLVQLVRIAGQIEDVTGLVSDADKDDSDVKTSQRPQAEGPQIHGEKREDVVTSQDEVDDLLSSLGF